MYPKLIDFGEITLLGYSFHPILHTYGFLLAAGFLLGLKFAASRAKSIGVETHRIMDLGLYVLIAALVGAKLLLLVVEWDHYRHDPWSLLRSGGIFYGGLIAAIVTALLYFSKYRLPPWKMADVVAPAIALGHGVGRLGCFSAGCCYGKPTSSILGVVFTQEYAHQVVGVPLSVALHPTQLYEAGAEFLIFLALVWMSTKKSFDGQIFWSYVALYAVARFIIEFFRGDPRGLVFDGTLSTSQFIAILMLGTALAAMAILRRRPKARPA